MTRPPACSLAHSDGQAHPECPRCVALAKLVRAPEPEPEPEPPTLPYLPEVE